MEQPIQHRGRFLGVVGTLQDSRADRKLGCGGTVLLGCSVTPGTYVAPSWSSGRNGPCPRWTAARDGRSSTTVTSNTTVRRSTCGLLSIVAARSGPRAPMRPSSPERDPGRKVAALVRPDRAQVRDALGFRPATRADEEARAGWLAAEVAPAEPSDDRLRETLLTRCRNEHLEPPGRVDRLVASARAAATDRFCAATVARLDQGAADRLAGRRHRPHVAGRGSRSWPSSKLTPAGPAWRRCSARWPSSKIYSRLALADAQQRYDQVITRSPSDPRRYLAAWATLGRTGPGRGVGRTVRFVLDYSPDS